MDKSIKSGVFIMAMICNGCTKKINHCTIAHRYYYNGCVQIPLHRITDSASNGSVFPVVTEHFSASSDHVF